MGIMLPQANLSRQELSVEELRAKVGTGMDIADAEKHMLLSMGPQHPSTHGVLRLLVELDGETVVNMAPDIGFLHTGIEKNMESKTFTKALVMTDRMDYLSPMTNNMVYIMAVRKLLGIEITPRAQTIRLILAELSRLSSHLVWLGTHALDLAAMSVFLYCFREREYILDIYEMVAGQRMMVSYFRPGGLWRDVPEEFEPAVRRLLDFMPAKIADYEALLDKNRFSWHAPRTWALSPASKPSPGVSAGRACAAPASIGTTAAICPMAATKPMSSTCRWSRRATSMPATAAGCARCANVCACCARASTG